MNTVVNEKTLLGALEAVLRRIPDLTSLAVEREVEVAGGRLDALLGVALRGLDAQRWVVEAKAHAVEPNAARLLAMQLSKAAAELHTDYAVVVAPFVSRRAGDILQRAGIGYCDLSGNCFLASGPVLVERVGFSNAFARTARHGSLFTAGAERILRAVLDPEHLGRAWTVRDLADAAWPGVSVGQAHKVAKKLASEDHLLRVDTGLEVHEPGRLLEAWAVGYRAERSSEHRYYSPLSAEELRERFAALVVDGGSAAPVGAIASFSAAELVAPHVRQHRFFVYWQGEPTVLKQRLELKTVSVGENVVVRTPYDEGVLYPLRRNRWPVTCAVQTFVDLRAAPGRGDEAAQAVFEKSLREAYDQ